MKSRYNVFTRSLLVNTLPILFYPCAYYIRIYYRIQYEDGTVVIRFVSSKAKVAPLSRQTIPWLELMGATLLV